MKPKRKLGIIGCGAVTQKNYLSTLPFYPDIAIACVHDLNSSIAQKVAEKTGARVVSVEAIKSECEIVVIATPPSSHASLVEEMLASGRTVICEKPFVGTKRDAERLAQLASERNSKLLVSHFRRCFSSVRLARSIVQSGILGTVKKISAYEGGRFSWQTESGYVYKDPYGGVLFDTGSHTLDMVLHVACFDSGSLEVRSAEVARDCPEPSHELEAKALLVKDGREIKSHFKFSRIVATANKIRVDCENGFVELPIGLVNYVRLGKQGGKSIIVRARESYENLMDCFALQFKQMFYDDPERTFSAEKFINLSALLEAVSKA